MNSWVEKGYNETTVLARCKLFSNPDRGVHLDLPVLDGVLLCLNQLIWLRAVLL